jgi:hypothetical protein
MRDPISVLPGVNMIQVGQQVKTLLTDLQRKLDCQIVVTSGYRQGDKAEHGKGQAVDIIVPDYKGRLLDLYMIAERFNFGGIGVYPEWSFNGVVTGGLHLDTRVNLTGARWVGVKVAGSNEYLGLTQDVLKKYGVI